MGVIAHFATDRGLLKENNEDAGGVFFGGRLVIVADGMGGGKAGEYASQQAVNQVREVVGQAKYYVDGVGLQVDGAGREVGSRGLEMAVQHANTFLHSMARTNPSLQGMGTTLVACLIEDGRALFANVGDSRGYVLRGGVLRQITRDHSLFSDPKATKSNIITRALGRRSYAEVDCFSEQLLPGDLVVLCSDGLSKVVPEDIIARQLSRPGVELPEVLAALVAEANAQGGPDNISLAVVKVDTLLGERCAGQWQPTPGVGDSDQDGDDRLEQTLVFKPGSLPPLEQKAPPPQVAPAGRRTPQPPRSASSAGRRPLLLAVAGCGLVVLIVAVLAMPRGKAATQLLAVEVRALAEEAGRPMPITVLRGGAKVWEATVEVKPSGGWRLVVKHPAALAATHEPDGQGRAQALLPAENLSQLEVVLGERLLADVDGGASRAPMSRFWQGGQAGYRLSLLTAGVHAARAEVWTAAMRGEWQAAEAALERSVRGASREIADAERRRLESWRSAWEQARRAGEELRRAADSRDSDGLLRLPSCAEDFKGAVGQLDGLRPPGTPALKENVDALRIAPTWANVERRLAHAQRLRQALDEAEQSLRSSGAGRLPENLANQLTGALQAASVLPVGRAASLLQAAAQSVPATKPVQSAAPPTPRPTETQIVAAPAQPPPPPVDRWASVRALADELERVRRQLKRDVIQQRLGDPALRGELNGLRSRSAAVLRPALQGAGLPLPPDLNAAVVEFVKLESHIWNTAACELRPREDALDLLRDIAALPGQHRNMAENTLREIRGCP